MPLWDKVKHELDRAGRAASDALDEGKVRLEAFRVRQLADKAAQHLGYAVFRANEAGRTLDAETLARYAATLAAHEAEASRLEAQLAAHRGQHPGTPDAPGATGASAVQADEGTGQPVHGGAGVASSPSHLHPDGPTSAAGGVTDPLGPTPGIASDTRPASGADDRGAFL